MKKHLLKEERGFLVLETLVTIACLMVILSMVVVSTKHTEVIIQSLETSQAIQIREYSKLYKSIAPRVAQTLNIGDSVVISINSPNYLPNNTKKYLNLFENYSVTNLEWTREQLDTPLVIYNAFKNRAYITIARQDINTYACEVNIYYYDYREMQPHTNELNPERVTTLLGGSHGVHIEGRTKQYAYTFYGEIVETLLRRNPYD